MNFKSFFFSFKFLLLAFPVLFFAFFISCNDSQPEQTIIVEKDSLVYLNHSDSAKYVGMNTCRQCHQDIYNSFIKTGMGKSFDVATREKSAADFSSAHIYDAIANFHYNAFWQSDSLYMKEYRLDKKDTVFKRLEQVNYIIG